VNKIANWRTIHVTRTTTHKHPGDHDSFVTMITNCVLDVCVTNNAFTADEKGE